MTRTGENTAAVAPRLWGTGALLGPLAMVSPFSIDTFFPSFHAISAEFGLSSWQIQQTLTVYMVPYALMALAHGPLSDAVGRKPVIMIGLAIYTAASIACALTPSFPLLLTFRALQGMTAGVGFVVGRAIVRDLHAGAQAQRLMSLITVIFGLAPAIAPIVGGFIHVAFGWRAVFVFMALTGAVLLTASSLRLNETHARERRVRFHPAQLAHTAARIVRHREFALCALAAGLNYAAVLSFVAAAPAIIVHHWHLKETQFGWLFLPLIAGFTIGAALSGRLAGRIPPERQVAVGFGLTLASIVALAMGYYGGAIPVQLQQLLLAIDGVGVQMVTPILTLRMVDLFPNARGSAASVQSFVSLTLMSAVMGVIAPLLQHSLLALAACALLANVAAVRLWLGVRKLVAPDVGLVEAD